MSNNLSIVSDGTAAGTRVLAGEIPLQGVTKIEILPITHQSIVSARITVSIAALRMKLTDADIQCDDELAADKIKKALLMVPE